MLPSIEYHAGEGSTGMMMEPEHMIRACDKRV